MVKSKSRGPDSIVVIGLGRFGGAVAESLMRLGHEVLALDENESIVESWASKLTHVVQADTTNIDTLRRLGVDDFERAIVGIGTDIEASLMTVLALSELGLSDIWAKALGPKHGKLLTRTGAHHVIYPEASMGERVAHLVTGKMIDFIEFDDGFAIAKTRAAKVFFGKSLAECALRSRFGITVVGVKRFAQDFTYATSETRIEPGDLLIVSGSTELVERFAASE